MAGPSSAQDLPPGHLQSPLFKMIPTEVRLDIYRHAFAGSETALQLHPDGPESRHRPRSFLASHFKPSPPGPLPIGGRRSVFHTRRRDLKYQLLLTCKQIYNEALAIYWSETIVCNDQGRFSRSLFFERIPDFAKLHIKHLRDVQTCVNPGVRALRGIASSRQASFAEALDAFPKLQTCSVQDEEWGTEPSKAVEEALARLPEVHILKTYLNKGRKRTIICKVCFWPASWCLLLSYATFISDTKSVPVSNLELSQRTYIDFTTGAEYTAEEDTRLRTTRTDEEEGFRHVMEMNSSREAGGNCEA